MDSKPATILSFEASTGEGVARLAEGGPLADVRFSLTAFRGGVPEKGLRVLLGALGADPGSGGPLSDTFAMRAGLVERASEWPELPIIHTVGVEAAERWNDERGTPFALVPFDPSAFAGVASAWPEELVSTLAFAPASPAPSESDLPAHLELLAAALKPVARRALACRAIEGDEQWGTLVAGDAADIGDAPWPTHRKKPMLPLIQISKDHARRLGLDQQINVFISARPRESSTPHLHVIIGEPGARQVGPKALGEREVLTVVDEPFVYPDIIGLQTAYRVAGRKVPLDLSRFWEVRARASDQALVSIQAELAARFPTSDDLEADVLLGGFSKIVVPRGGRLATFSVARFAWLHALYERTAALELGADHHAAFR